MMISQKAETAWKWRKREVATCPITEPFCVGGWLTAAADLLLMHFESVAILHVELRK